MFWICILIGLFALMFAQLGAYSVWVSIFSVCLKLALLVIACLGIALLWRKVSGQKKLKTKTINSSFRSLQ